MKVLLSLKVTAWPEVDQRLWSQAQQPPAFLERSKPASQWSPKRRRIVEQAYGQWLSWLLRHGRLPPDLHPGKRVTPEMVDRFVRDLSDRVASNSVSMMLCGLQRMMQVLAPNEDWVWLRKMYSHVKAAARPERRTTAHVVPPEQLFKLGQALMDTPCPAKNSPRYCHSTRYRDGLIIATLISCPIRISNLESIEIGRHLQFEDGQYWLSIPDEETKTNTGFEGDLPSMLTPYLDRYLEFHRPFLLARSKGDVDARRLWLDRSGKPMTEHALRDQINKHTREAFGRNVWPHLFRHCAATGLVDEAPEDIGIAPDLLGHASIRTTQKYYVLACGTRAHQAVQRALSEARQEARRRVKT